MGTRTALLALVTTLCAFAESSQSPKLEPHQFRAYRLIQYDLDGNSYGSRRTNFDAHVKTVSADAILSKARELRRHVILARFQDMTQDGLDALERIAPSLAGVLLILPNMVAEMDAETVEQCKSVENALLRKKMETPVYFVFENERVMEIYNDAVNSESANSGWGSGGDDFRLLLGAPGSKPLVLTPMVNLQGWLAGASPSRGSAQQDQRTIAVVAHYDVFAAAPALATGADSNGSGILALLELARLFSSLYQSSRAHGKYNLLFVLTAAGHLQFGGARHWLDEAEPGLLQSIDFVLCLDSIASSDRLRFHSAKSTTSEGMRHIFEAFEGAGKAVGVPVEAVHKRINVTEGTLHWEHEAFTYKRIPAATISARPSPPPVFGRSSLFDVASPTRGIDTLQLHIRCIAEGLSRLVYPAAHQLQEARGLEVFTGSLGVDADFLQSWSAYLSRTARAAPFLTSQGVVVAELQSMLQARTQETSRQPFALEDERFTFYDVTNSTVDSFRVKSSLIDVALFVGVTAYCLALHTALRFAVVGFDAFYFKQLRRFFAGK